MFVQEGVRHGRKSEQGNHCEDPAGDLEDDRAPEEPTQPPPVLARQVAKAELDQCLLDGEVEQALEQPRRREDERVEAERVRREDVQRDHGPEEPENRRGVRAGGSDRAAPEQARAHETANCRDAVPGH